MSVLTIDNLTELVTQALERTAFVLVDTIEESQASELPPLKKYASITYSGPTSGHVHLGASDGFLCQLAASILGVEPNEVDVKTHGLDALKELANIVGGSVIVQLGGQHCTYSLSLPELTKSLPKHRDADCWCHMSSEGERLTIVWSASGQTSAKAA